jgi:hypothetical protein
VFKKLSQEDGGIYRATTAAPATSDSMAEAMKPLFTLRRTGRPELELVPEGAVPEAVLDPEAVLVLEAAGAVLLTVTPKLDEEPPTGVTGLMVGPAAPEEFPELLDVAVEEASLLETSGPTLKEGDVA